MMPAAVALALFVSAAAPPAAAPPTVAEARQLSAQKAWDELYLRFSAAQVKGFKDPDRKVIAAALLEGSRALLAEDLALAVACAEKSAAFAPTVEAWLAAGDADLKLKQLAAAAAAYEKAVLLAPTHARALMSRADLALEEGEPGLAVSLYSKVPAKAPEFKSAQEKLAKARAAEKERARADAELSQADRKSVVATRKQVAEDPAALSFEKLCATSMRAVCGLAHKCMPEDPATKVCDASVDEQCAKLPGASKVSKKELEACVAALSGTSCEKFLGGVRVLTELAPVCAPVDAAMSSLDAP